MNSLKKNSTRAKKPFQLSEGTISVISSIISIVVGFVIGFIILIILELTKAESNIQTSFSVMGDFIGYAFKDSGFFIKVFYNAAPLVLTGLSVGFAFKAGLFNIGAAGQYIIGAYFALMAVILWGFPWWAALIIAMIAGAIWGFIPGFFKAKFNINEVITTIMLNWAALSLVNLLLLNMPNLKTLPPYNRTDPIGYHNPSGLIPDFGLKEILGTQYINISILIAILIAVVVYIVLNKTTFGYEIKACGYNKNAGVYAGIKAKRTIILTMIIAGGLAGIAGGLYYLAGTAQFPVQDKLAAMGFNGIPVALLANSNPLGIIASGIFIGYLQVGGQAFEGVYSSEMTNVILSIIIYFSAFTLIVSQFIRNIIKKRKRNLESEDDDEDTPSTKDPDVEPSPPDKPPKKGEKKNKVEVKK